MTCAGFLEYRNENIRVSNSFVESDCGNVNLNHLEESISNETSEINKLATIHNVKPTLICCLAHMCNGDLADVSHFLMNGLRRNCQPLWYPDDDLVALRTNKANTKRILQKFSREELLNRLVYFTSTDIASRGEA